MTRAGWTSIVVSSAVLTSAPAAAQDTIFVPRPGRIAIRDLKLVPAVDLVPGVHVHTVIGPTGSVSLGEFDSAGTAPLHHHTREQANFPAGRTFIARIDTGDEQTLVGETCTMRWRRVVAPSDLHPQETAAELFVYVVRGDANIAAAGRTFHAGAGTLAIVPATLRHVELRPTKGDVAIVEFTTSHAP